MPDVKLYYKANAIKTVWYCHKKRHKSMEQNREPRNKPCVCGLLIFDKGDRSIQWRQNSLFNKWCWENWTGTSKKMKLDYQLTPYTRINSKWVKDLNISHDTKKVLEENISRIISDNSHGNIFANLSPKASKTKKKQTNGTTSN